MNLMARALYDNMPECAEELSFRKGDILTVIEQNTGGLEGWWLCSLHGRQGIAPGNRLKLLIGPVSESYKHENMKQEVHPQIVVPQQIYQVPQASHQDSIYQVPPSPHNPVVYKVSRGYASENKKPMTALPESMDSSPGNNVKCQPRMMAQGYSSPDCTSRWQANVYDIPPTRPQGVYDVPATVKGSKYSSSPPKDQGIYDVPSSQGVYNTLPPNNGKMYDFPSSSKKTVEPTYDILPPSSTSFPQEKSSKLSMVTSPQLEATRKSSVYDFPRSQQTQSQSDDYDFPRGVQSENFVSDGQDGVYDFPPQAPVSSKVVQDVTDGVNRLSFSSTGSTRSNMSTSSTTSKESSVTSSPLQEPKLLLDPDTAIEKLLRLQHMVEVSVSQLTAFVNSEWRSYKYMERHINEIHSAVDHVERSLGEYLQLAKGATTNASYLQETGLYNKMRREFQRLDDSYHILVQTSQDLNSCGWSINVLAINKANNKCDSLERFVMVAKTIIDDAKQLTTTITINAELLFKQSTTICHKKRPSDSISFSTDYMCNTSQPQVIHDDMQSKMLPHMLKEQSSKSLRSWMDDYDYVHLQGKEEFERQQRELLEKENITKQGKPQLEQYQLNKFQQLEQEITAPVENDMTKWKSPHGIHAENSSLVPQEKRLLSFYSNQCESLFISLLNAIDAFFNCMSSGQPPRIFVAHSKFVILSAHKLVFIGDTLARQVVTQDICKRLMNSSNQLCELLKTIVMATKMAALNYPSSASLQEMVDRVTELSNQAQLFKLSLAQMASL
ncbi:enhancer of filamentation 1 isoform X2 [Xenopus laevis]|uniref:Breast cancer anti-estrogen resistance protein 1 n=1 Tax=Xenopus laevis TaxID=8355 RepID=A0A8J1KZQ7_XENLA|nr:enhancer of filamentation 1 isoform X2 [Xenopus laevis]